ncbi:DUF485 domain-containing protein [Kitasatospora sp. NPDC101447]|uniref:DUF485 domain-containing protein n=1 Tax=Kitasatospora sp. NPDC101447 TaxID=3364102 RepID=UPI0038308180
MPQQQASSPGQGQRFDWWAAPAAGIPSDTPSGDPADAPSGVAPGAPSGIPPGFPSEQSAAHRRTAVPAQPVPVRTAPTHPAPAHTAPARAEHPVAAGPEPWAAAAPVDGTAVPPVHRDGPPAAAAPEAVDRTEVYRAVQASAAFQAIRHSYRSFVFPVAGAFLGWYLLYVAAQAAAPGLMRTPVAGPFNVAWLLGLLQFASTFLLTWLYARNARTKRDRAALGLRWDTQDQLR